MWTANIAPRSPAPRKLRVMDGSDGKPRKSRHIVFKIVGSHAHACTRLSRKSRPQCHIRVFRSRLKRLGFHQAVICSCNHISTSPGSLKVVAQQELIGGWLAAVGGRRKVTRNQCGWANKHARQRCDLDHHLVHVNISSLQCTPYSLGICISFENLTTAKGNIIQRGILTQKHRLLSKTRVGYARTVTTVFCLKVLYPRDR